MPKYKHLLDVQVSDFLHDSPNWSSALELQKMEKDLVAGLEVQLPLVTDKFAPLIFAFVEIRR